MEKNYLPPMTEVLKPWGGVNEYPDYAPDLQSGGAYGEGNLSKTRVRIGFKSKNKKRNKMTNRQKEARTVLRHALSTLTSKQRERLSIHAQRKTPICCGDDAWRYVDGKGSG